VIVVRPTVRYGRTIPIRGRLTMPGGNPVADGAIEVWELTRSPGAEWRRIALIGTDAVGRFMFKALRGPSRVLRFRYPGTALVRARTTEVEIKVAATSTLDTSRNSVVNGDEIVLRGRVLGRPLPAFGKLVQLQAYSRGRWLTFATPRASATSARWSYRYRFTATRGTVRYRFRIRVPQEAGFPYAAGTSRSVHVLVRGL
jgi:protocatechuate 3,4-dioxygenase beta subunit